jgi:hypothetical protein
MGATIYLSLVAIAVFLALKLAGVVDLSWWWLAIPVMVLLGCVALIGLIILAVSRGP